MTQNRPTDAFQDTIRFSQHLIVPESQDGKTLAAQPSIATVVSRSVLYMLPTVTFNNETLLKTDEVDNVRPYRLLTPKFQTVQSTGTQM